MEKLSLLVKHEAVEDGFELRTRWGAGYKCVASSHDILKEKFADIEAGEIFTTDLPANIRSLSILVPKEERHLKGPAFLFIFQRVPEISGGTVTDLASRKPILDVYHEPVYIPPKRLNYRKFSCRSRRITAIGDTGRVYVGTPDTAGKIVQSSQMHFAVPLDLLLQFVCGMVPEDALEKSLNAYGKAQLRRENEECEEKDACIERLERELRETKGVRDQALRLLHGLHKTASDLKIAWSHKRSVRNRYATAREETAEFLKDNPSPLAPVASVDGKGLVRSKAVIAGRRI